MRTPGTIVYPGLRDLFEAGVGAGLAGGVEVETTRPPSGCVELLPDGAGGGVLLGIFGRRLRLCLRELPFDIG